MRVTLAELRRSRLFARLRVQPTTTRRVVAQKGALTRRGHKK